MGNESLVLHADILKSALDFIVTCREAAGVINIEGSRGLGKSRLLERIKKGIFALDEPIVLLSASSPYSFSAETSEHHLIEDKLLDSLCGNQITLSSILADFKDSMAREGGDLAWGERLASALGSLGGETKIVFLLDDYFAWREDQRQWFQDQVADPLSLSGIGSRCIFVLASKAGDGRRFSLGGGSPERRLELSLPPMSLEQSRVFLSSEGLEIREKDFLLAFNYSKGIPGVLLEAAKHKISGALHEKEAEGVMRFLSELQGGVKRWVMLVVSLGKFSQGELDFYLGLHDSLSAIRWLSSKGLASRLGQEFNVGDIWVRHAAAYFRKNDFDAFSAIELQVKSRRMLEAHVSHIEDIRFFVLLSIFNFFSLSLLEEVYPSECSKLKAFIKENLNYFSHYEGIYSFKAEYRSLILEYNRCFPFKNEDQFRVKAEGFWVEREKDLRSELESLVSFLKEDESSLALVGERLAALEKKLRKERMGMAKKTSKARLKKKKVKAKKKPEGRLGLTSLFLEVIGIMLLYLAIYQGKGMYWFYGGVGIVLIGWGLFGPLTVRWRSRTKESDSLTPNSLEPEENKVLLLLEAEKKSLKEDSLSLRRDIKEGKIAIERLERQLQMPYL